MKKLLLLICLIVIISCSNKEDSLNEKPFAEESFTVKEYSTSSLVEEKFMEFYDLQILLVNKPEFKESITKRLNSFKVDTNQVLKLNKNTKINNIRATKLSENKENNHQTLKVYFDIILENIVEKDSILAFVTKNSILIEHETINSTKVKFTKFLHKKRAKKISFK